MFYDIFYLFKGYPMVPKITIYVSLKIIFLAFLTYSAKTPKKLFVFISAILVPLNSP